MWLRLHLAERPRSTRRPMDRKDRRSPQARAIHAGHIRAGEILFTRYCFYCHGVGAVSSSSVPDLRYLTALTNQQFEAIVLGGARQGAGMPSFHDALKPDQLKTIQAYILDRAIAAKQAASSTP